MRERRLPYATDASLMSDTHPALSPLTAFSDDTLIKLRHAPYARHGRPFKLTSLQAFFYGKRDGDRRTTLLPLVPDPAFKESMLDATDTQNVHAVVTEQNRRNAKK